MPNCTTPVPHLLLLLLLLLLVTCCNLSDAQKKSEPQCLGGADRVCNAVIHFPDKVVDQGRYCNGCANCSEPVGLDAPNSFLWQHFEHTNMRVQFLKCGSFPAKRPCDSRDIKAAVFVSPRESWQPVLEQLYCTCPVTDRNAKVPVYHLTNWHMEEGQWVYEFGCKSAKCNVSAPVLLQKERLVGSVCAKKRKSQSEGPVGVSFVCSCPPEFHCDVSEPELKAGEQQAADANEVSEMDRWLHILDETTGEYVFEKRHRCERRLVNQTSTAN